MTTTSTVPGPSPLQFAWQLYNRHDEAPIEIFMALAREYGPLVLVQMPKGSMMLASSQALAAEICDESRYQKRGGPGLEQARQLVADGLFTAHNDEPNWHKAHSILMPAFAEGTIKSYLPQMEEIAARLLAKWDGVTPEQDVDVPADMTRLTLDTIALCGFGYSFDSFDRPDVHPFVAAMNAGLQHAQDKITRPAFLDWLHRKPDDTLKNSVGVMYKIVDEIIAGRRKSGERKRDLLDVMLYGTDRQTGTGLDDVNIRNQILTFLIAGHETTSGLLSFAIYNLLHHPQALARAQAEVDRVLGATAGVMPTIEQVGQLQYVLQILKETLRLYPTAPMFGRTPLKETLLGGKYPVKPGDGVTVLTIMLHRDKAVWGDDAEEFRPERFTHEAEAKLPPHAYKPFGTGMRACIGRPFALQEATLVLALLLRRYEFIDAHKYALHIRQSLTIKPAEFHIRIRRRAGVEATVALRPAVDAPPSSVPQAAAACPYEPAAAASCPYEAAPAAAASTATGTPLLVLFGSNMGTSERLAHQIAEDGRARGFAPTVGELDSYVDKLPREGAVVVVTSSYNGTPPDNAVAFCRWLDEAPAPHALDGVKYAVFGCGNHEWVSTFEAIPRKVDGGLAARGAERILDHGEGDAADDFDHQFQTWYAKLWPALSSRLGVALPEVAAADSGPLYSVEVLENAHPNPLASSFNAQPMVVIENRELHRKDGADPSPRSTRHLEVALPDGVSYRTGDHLGVVARNPAALVARAAARFALSVHSRVRVHQQRPGKSNLPVDEIVSVGRLLGDYVELHDVARRADIQTLAKHSADSTEISRLNRLASSDEDYRREILLRNCSLVDLLEECPSCHLPFGEFLEMLPLLRPRYYSISSSPLKYERIASITVGRVEAPARSGHGVYQGTCSTLLCEQPKGTAIVAFVQDTKSNFRLPSNPLTPIIMIGPGTGVAPFRGFLQERAALQARGEKLGKAVLFFGCRNESQDFIYGQELRGFERDGVVDLHVACSRVEGKPRQYVQNAIEERRDELFELLEQGAIVYVCGEGAHMAPSVQQAFVELYKFKTNKTDVEASAWMEALVKAERYRTDVWAAG